MLTRHGIVPRRPSSVAPGRPARRRRGSRPPRASARAPAPRRPRGRAAPPARISAAHSGGRRPSPTASRQPTSDRTMLWQNASARTVATATPVGVARPRRAPAGCGSWSRPRAACRTTRSRAARAAAPDACVHRVQVQRPRPGQHVPARQRVDERRRRRRPGRRSAATARRTGRRSPSGRLGDPAYPHVRRQDAVEPRAAAGRVGRRPRRAGRGATTWPRAWTPASVRPAHTSVDRRAPAARWPARPQLALHGPQPRLGRPAVEVGPVVGEVDPQPHGRHPRLHRPSVMLMHVTNPAIVLVSAEHADFLLDEFGRYARDYDLHAVDHGRATAPDLAPRAPGRRRPGRAVRAPTPRCPTPTSDATFRKWRAARARPPAGSWSPTGTASSPTRRRLRAGPGHRQVRRLPADAARGARRGVPHRDHRAALRLGLDRGRARGRDGPASSRRPGDPLTLAIRDFLDRMGMPNRVLRPGHRGRPRDRASAYDGEPTYPLVDVARPRRRSRRRSVRDVAAAIYGRPDDIDVDDRRRPLHRRRRPGRARRRGLRRIRGPVDGRARGRRRSAARPAPAR